MSEFYCAKSFVFHHKKQDFKIYQAIYFQNYEIIKKSNLSDDKISKLIRECIKPTIINTLNKKLEYIPFSLSFYETNHKLSCSFTTIRILNRNIVCYRN